MARTSAGCLPGKPRAMALLAWHGCRPPSGAASKGCKRCPLPRTPAATGPLGAQVASPRPQEIAQRSAHSDGSVGEKLRFSTRSRRSEAGAAPVIVQREIELPLPARSGRQSNGKAVVQRSGSAASRVADRPLQPVVGLRFLIDPRRIYGRSPEQAGGLSGRRETRRCLLRGPRASSHPSHER